MREAIGNHSEETDMDRPVQTLLGDLGENASTRTCDGRPEARYSPINSRRRNSSSSE